MHDNEAYDPTPEEWAEIEEAMVEEEERIRTEGAEEDKIELDALKIWLKENGMAWDIK